MDSKNDPHRRLRSAMWSSDTLVKGMSSVQNQPNFMMVKTEDDSELLREYQVPFLAHFSNLLIVEISLLPVWCHWLTIFLVVCMSVGPPCSTLRRWSLRLMLWLLQWMPQVLIPHCQLAMASRDRVWVMQGLGPHLPKQLASQFCKRNLGWYDS